MEHPAETGSSGRNAARGVFDSAKDLRQCLAIELRVPVTRISEILNERRGITADTALRLERYFGMSADFWVGLQKDFDLQTVRLAEGKKVSREIRPRPNRLRDMTDAF